MGPDWCGEGAEVRGPGPILMWFDSNADVLSSIVAFLANMGSAGPSRVICGCGRRHQGLLAPVQFNLTTPFEKNNAFHDNSAGRELN